MAGGGSCNGNGCNGRSHSIKMAVAIDTRCRWSTSLAEKPTEDLFTGKATTAEKRKFLDPMVGSLPPFVDFMASVSGEDVSLVDKPVDMATTSAGGFAPLTAAGGQVKIEAPPRYSGKR